MDGQRKKRMGSLCDGSEFEGLAKVSAGKDFVDDQTQIESETETRQIVYNKKKRKKHLRNKKNMEIKGRWYRKFQMRYKK